MDEQAGGRVEAAGAGRRRGAASTPRGHVPARHGWDGRPDGCATTWLTTAAGRAALPEAVVGRRGGSAGRERPPERRAWPPAGGGVASSSVRDAGAGWAAKRSAVGAAEGGVGGGGEVTRSPPTRVADAGGEGAGVGVAEAACQLAGGKRRAVQRPRRSRTERAARSASWELQLLPHGTQALCLKEIDDRHVVVRSVCEIMYSFIERAQNGALSEFFVNVHALAATPR